MSTEKNEPKHHDENETHIDVHVDSRLQDATVSLKALVPLFGVLLGIIGFGAGWLWDGIGKNQDNIKDVNIAISNQRERIATENTQLRVAIENAIASSNEFHTEQRVRIWNRINENEATVNKIDTRLSLIEGSITNMNGNVDRILDLLLLEKRAERNRDVNRTSED